MTKSVLREIARWVRALALPCAALASVLIVDQLAGPVREWFAPLGADGAVGVARVAGFGAAATWVAVAAVRTLIQPRRDRAAAEHLQDLRVRAGLPGHTLICVLDVHSTMPAGCRVSGVDIRTGARLDLWLAEQGLPRGAFALVRQSRDALSVAGVAEPDVIAAAQRHEARTSSPSTAERPARHAARLIREAERIQRAEKPAH